MADQTLPAASPEARIREVVEDDFSDYCGHIFEWDPAWDDSVADLHCPECLDRARTLAARIADALEPEPPAGTIARFVPRRVDAVEAMRVEDPSSPAIEWCGGTVVSREGRFIGVSFRNGPPAGGSSWFALPGEWIVKDPDGSFRAMGAEQFAAEYTPEADRG